MKKCAVDPDRESRIENQAIPDANGPEEKSSSWHCYLEERLQFPFAAKCTASVLTSPLKTGETVEALDMAPQEHGAQDMLVVIRWQNRKLAVPLSQLSPIDVSEDCVEAVGDWHYWVARGYLF